MMKANKQMEWTKELDQEYESLKEGLQFELDRMLSHLDNVSDSYARIVSVRGLYRSFKENNDILITMGKK